MTALLVSKYDIYFAPGEDGSRLHEGTLDCFAQMAGKLELVFRVRSDGDGDEQ